MLNDTISSAESLSDPVYALIYSLSQDIRRLLTAIQTMLSPPEPAATAKSRGCVRVPGALQILDIGRSHFYAMQNPNDPAWDPTLPKSFKLGDSPRSPTVWWAHELETWLEARAAKFRKAN